MEAASSRNRRDDMLPAQASISASTAPPQRHLSGPGIELGSLPTASRLKSAKEKAASSSTAPVPPHSDPNTGTGTELGPVSATADFRAHAAQPRVLQPAQAPPNNPTSPPSPKTLLIGLTGKMDELNKLNENVEAELNNLRNLVSKNSMEGNLCHARCCIEHCGKYCGAHCKQWCDQHFSRSFIIFLFLIGSALVVSASVISGDKVVFLSLSASFFLSSVSIFSLWCRP